MSKKRDTYTYHQKIGNEIVHSGITNDLQRREKEHQQRWPKSHITQVVLLRQKKELSNGSRSNPRLLLLRKNKIAITCFAIATWLVIFLRNERLVYS